MQEDEFAKRLSQAFRLDQAPVLRTRNGGATTIAVIELRHDAANFGMTGPMHADDAHLLCLHLADIGRIECWQDNRSQGIRSIGRGSCTVHDLRRQPFICVDEPFHILAFRLPGAVFGRATDAGIGTGILEDRVLWNLALSFLPFFEGSVKQNQLYIDHALQAVGAHVSSAHGDAEPDRVAYRGGLAPWQQRRAQELLRSHLTDGISLDAVAQACCLSPSGFLRAFRKSVGLPPHQWLLRCRVDRAAELLRDGRMTLSQIALCSGFCDQSHFTRAFAQRMGLSPGAWRKAQPGMA